MGSRPALFKPVYEFGLADVHIDDSELRLPVLQDGRRLLRVRRNARGAGAVVERQLNHAGQHGLVHHQQCARRRGRMPGGFRHLRTLPDH